MKNLPNSKSQTSQNCNDTIESTSRDSKEIDDKGVIKKIKSNRRQILLNLLIQPLDSVRLPATFQSEPLSFLQRMAENLEYSSLLDEAAQCTNSIEQIKLVSAFSITMYNTYSSRVLRDFNPLLNETYEFDRRLDLGWRTVSEQVSHHPPRMAHVS